MERLLGDCVSAWALLLCLIAQVDSQHCAGPCNCTELVTHCPEGVPLVKDGCQCCQICARQMGEACDQRNICDIQQGLQCNYSARNPGGPGECVTHRPHRGWPGVLDHEQKRIPNQNQVQNGIRSGIQSHKRIPNQNQISASGCIKRSTEWSACSRSCGPGVSIRVSNQNQFCRLERQTRFCQVRPCWTAPPKTHTGLVLCEASHRSSHLEHLKHGFCQSLLMYRPKHCPCSGAQCCRPFRTRTVAVPFACPTRGWMGRPRPMLFPVTVIDSCVCRSYCPLPGTTLARGTMV